MSTPADFIAQARALVGTPFMHQGRSREGLDCIGLPVLAAQLAGDIDVSWDRTNYPPDPIGWLQPALELRLERVTTRQPGDILLMRFGQEPQHVGIWTGATMIHAYSRAEKVIEHRLDDRWEKHVIATYRFKEFM